MEKTFSGKKIVVKQSENLYKWVKNFKRVQERFYPEKTKLRRILQIETFMKLNGYKKIFHINEVELDLEIDSDKFVNNIEDSDIVLVTDQKIGRYPCSGIINFINEKTTLNRDMYFCFNRSYINITNEKIDLDFPDDLQVSINLWLKTFLPNHIVVDMSKDYMEDGKHFTWSCPDRHYFIKRIS